MIVLVALLLVLSGCVSSVEETQQGSVQQYIDSPPTAEIVLDNPEERVPYYPSFSYSCNDPEGQLKYCILLIDGNEIYRWGPYPENLDWPDNLTLDYIREPGEHTIELVAVDAEGQEDRDVETIRVRKEIRAYVEALPTGMDEKYYQSLEEAFSYWEDKLGIDFVKVESDEDIYIDWAKEYAGETIGRAEVAGKRMIIGLGDSYCFEKYRPYSEEAVRNIAIHELGHILGYEHVDDPADYMNPIIPNISYEVEVNESFLIPSNYYWYIQPCSNSGLFEVRVESDEPINIYQIASKEDYEKALQGKAFRYKSDCYEKGTTYFQQVCSFEEGNLLMLTYDGRDAANVRVVMKKLD